MVFSGAMHVGGGTRSASGPCSLSGTELRLRNRHTNVPRGAARHRRPGQAPQLRRPARPHRRRAPSRALLLGTATAIGATLAAQATLSGGLRAQAAEDGTRATAYVPILDPAYADVELLAAADLVATLAAGEAPHSRAAFARWAVEAAERAASLGRPALRPRVAEALARLRRRFPGPSARPAPRADAPPADATATSTTASVARVDRPRPAVLPQPPQPAPVALRDAQVDLWLAQSPYRPLGPGAAGEIDGLLNPLLQRNQGRKIADGWTVSAEFAAEAESGRFAASLRPRAWLHALRGGESASVSATFHSAYARLVQGPLALEAGRNSVTMGYGRDGGPLLSGNARGFDMIRLATERPVRLPGRLRGWGQWRASALLARMGADRDVPGSWLSAFRLSNRPGRTVELGLVYVNLQGGDGAPDGTLGERAIDVFLPFLGGVIELSDKVSGIDVLVTVPSIRTHFFMNFVATDLRANREQALRAFWQDAIWAFGACAYGLGSQGRLDVWADAKSAGPLPHTHHQYTSGLTLDGRVLGDPLGPNARGVSVGFAWTASAWKAEATVAQERWSADEWVLAGAFEGDPRPWVWTKTAEFPSEVRRRLTLEWRREPEPGRIALGVRAAYERAANFAFTGRNRNNFAVRVRARWTGR